MANPSVSYGQSRANVWAPRVARAALLALFAVVRSALADRSISYAATNASNLDECDPPVIVQCWQPFAMLVSGGRRRVK